MLNGLDTDQRHMALLKLKTFLDTEIAWVNKELGTLGTSITPAK
jgi:hypothetical protein